jgi:ubiquinone/menaquinone biosynthesis C-methylase UbiE
MSLVRNVFLKGVFDRASYTYTSVGPKYFNYFGERLVELSKIRKDDIVLDVAIGRGASLFPASDTVGVLGKVIGIDFSEGMVLETKKILENLGKVDIEVFQMDAENLNFAESTFDNVICGLSIQFFSDYKKSLVEMYRVLKPGGRASISTWKKKDGKQGVIGRVAPKYLPEKIQTQNSSDTQTSRPDFGDEIFLKDILTEVGLKM